jgi:hypothetical protein
MLRPTSATALQRALPPMCCRRLRLHQFSDPAMCVAIHAAAHKPRLHAGDVATGYTPASTTAHRLRPARVISPHIATSRTRCHCSVRRHPCDAAAACVLLRMASPQVAPPNVRRPTDCAPASVTAHWLRRHARNVAAGCGPPPPPPPPPRPPPPPPRAGPPPPSWCSPGMAHVDAPPVRAATRHGGAGVP